MRRLRNSVILLSFIGLILIGRYNVALRAWAQTQAVAPNGLTALRIVSPKNGEKLQQNFVTVQYAQIQQASASSTPTFELQLDAQDPVHTATTSTTDTIRREKIRSPEKRRLAVSRPSEKKFFNLGIGFWGKLSLFNLMPESRVPQYEKD